MRKHILFQIVALVAAIVVATTPPAAAQKRLSFVRDAETETTIRSLATPLFVAAGLDPASIRVHLINDPTLNAFVAKGQNLFIHTGLLIRTENPSQLIGVIAHETGHIAGGHLARTNEEVGNNLYRMAIAAAVGLATAFATGNAGAALAGGALGIQVGERSFLAYSRVQESAADQAALTFLDRTGQSAKGLMEFMEILADQELLTTGRQDPYVRTHPISSERVGAIQSFVASSRFSNRPVAPQQAEMHARMRAKLMGFLEPARAFQTYRETDKGVPARYARAIAYYRQSDLPRALATMDSLLAERPGDPYFEEMKGQMLFENGRVGEALPLYEHAVKVLPDSALLRIELAHVQLEGGTADGVKAALENLIQALRLEGDNASAWRMLSIAYGRDGQLGMAALAQAEQAVLQGRRSDARQFADRAERQLPEGSPARLRAQDIKPATERERRGG